VNNIYAAIGPGIRGCCYRVGPEFREYFGNGGMGQFLIEKDKGLFFDLSGAVYSQLAGLGLDEQKIDFYGKCTCCSKKPSFFSNRKDGPDFEGQAAFIGIKS
jgi:polyphenol oxidase